MSEDKQPRKRLTYAQKFAQRGGKARAAALSAAQRSEIAAAAGKARASAQTAAQRTELARAAGLASSKARRARAAAKKAAPGKEIIPQKQEEGQA
jgi:hypothetical protein